MQTYEKVKTNTLRRVVTHVTDLQYEFWYQFLGTVNGSLAFVIALLFNNLILKVLPEEHGDVYQLLIVFALIGVSIIISRVKENWAFNIKERQQKAVDTTMRVVKDTSDLLDNASEMGVLLSKHNHFHK